jgi:S1-C subfamily serine protease
VSRTGFAIVGTALFGLAVSIVVLCAYGQGSAVGPDHPGAIRAAFPAPTVPDDGLDGVQEGFTALVAATRPAVVTIWRKGRSPESTPQSGIRFVDPYASGGTRLGAGVIIDPRGYVLTSAQVAGTAVQFWVSSATRQDVAGRAERVADDLASDLVLLRILDGGPFPALPLGDSDRVAMGDLVLAFGSPYGFHETVTFGIVSSTRRRVSIEGHRFEDLIQTDAHLNPGDSGGPLVNIDGEVIGINIGTLAMNSTFAGVGFAVGSNRARSLLARL